MDEGKEGKRTLVAGVERAAHEAFVAALSEREGTDKLVAKSEGSGGHVGVLVEEVHVDVPRVKVDDSVIRVGLSQLRVVISTSLSRKRRKK